MRFLITILSLIISVAASIAQPAISQAIVPKFIEGRNGTNSTRIPCAYWLTLSGLTPNANYRFNNQFVKSSDLATTAGAGNCIYPAQTGFIRTSGPGFSTSGTYGEFTADSNGVYGGWFVSEPTGNTRMVPGNYLFFRVSLNDGNNGTVATTRLTTADSIQILKVDSLASDSSGTAIAGFSQADPRYFVFVYDNIDGTGRPLSASFVESDGSDNSTANNYAAFYATQVNGVDGAFGLIVPNMLSTGVRRVELRSSTGSILAYNQSVTGIWPSGASTVNPSTGGTPIILDSLDVPLQETVVHSQMESMPSGFTLSQNYPNPFNPTTTISFSLPVDETNVHLTVFDLNGRIVAKLANAGFQQGLHRIEFDGSHLSSGTYIYRLSTRNSTNSKMMQLVK